MSYLTNPYRYVVAEPVTTCVSATYGTDAKALGGSGQFSYGEFLCLNKIDTSALSATFKVNSISVNFVANNGGTNTYKYASYSDSGGSPDALISQSAEYVWDGVTGITSQDMTSTPDITNNNTLWLALAIKCTAVNGADIQATTTGIGSGDCYYDQDDYDNWFPASAPTTTGNEAPNLFVKFCATTV